MFTLTKSFNNSNFTIVSNTVMNDNSISLEAKGLFAYIAHHANLKEISIKDLVGQFNEPRKEVIKITEELTNAGYIKNNNGDAICQF